ncbi:MAG: cysteine hydrolase [Alphaproteobacteria bacterium]|nr:cysteine hydrolase [Alphaproteobacteria bacterium]
MHKVSVPAETLEYIRVRRGKVHLYDTLDPAKTALVVIDMQDTFVSPEQPAYVPYARGIVPNINRLAEALRRSGGTVVWVITTFDDKTLDAWGNFFNIFYTPERRAMLHGALRDGASGHRLWHEMDRQADDWTVVKDRFSCFIQGSSDIEARLRKAGIDTVLITGTLTNVCCESSARDAMMRNFKVVMVSDGNAAATDAEHSATLSIMMKNFADVMTADEVIIRFAAQSAKAAAGD